MNRELSEELFKTQTGFCSDPGLLVLRSWKVVSSSYPLLEVDFFADGREPIRVKMLCDNWDELPPSVDLLDTKGVPLPKFPQGIGHSIFNNSAHPRTGRPFLCTPGIREYHEHSSHVGDSWDNHKNKSAFDLGGILTQIWRAWGESQ